MKVCNARACRRGEGGREGGGRGIEGRSGGGQAGGREALVAIMWALLWLSNWTP